MKLQQYEQRVVERVVDILSGDPYYFECYITGSPAQGNDASSSGGNDDNSNCRQPDNGLLAGDDIFRRRGNLSGPADRSGQVPETD